MKFQFAQKQAAQEQSAKEGTSQDLGEHLSNLMKKAMYNPKSKFYDPESLKSMLHNYFNGSFSLETIGRFVSRYEKQFK